MQHDGLFLPYSQFSQSSIYCIITKLIYTITHYTLKDGHEINAQKAQWWG